MHYNDLDTYGWKVVITMNRYTHKVVFVKDEESNSDEPVYKTVVKGFCKKRREIPLWFERLDIPRYMIDHTIEYNAKQIEVHRNELFQHMDFDEMDNVYLITLDVDTLDLKSSLTPKINGVYRIYRNKNNTFQAYDISDEDGEYPLQFEMDNCLYKNGVAIYHPRLV